MSLTSRLLRGRRRPTQRQPIRPVDPSGLGGGLLRHPLRQRRRGGRGIGRVQQRQRLRGGRAPLPARAAQVAVRQVERFQKRVPEVPPGEQVDAPAVPLAGVGGRRHGAASRRPPRPPPRPPPPARRPSGSAGRLRPAGRRGPLPPRAVAGASARRGRCRGPSPRPRG